MQPRISNPASVPGALEESLVSLIPQIGVINVFNRLNVATRQIAGEWAASAVEQLAS